MRNLRAERGFTPRDRFTLYIRGGASREANFFRDYGYLLTELARLNEVVVEGDAPAGAHQDVIEGFPIAIVFPEKVISEEQRDKVRRDIEKTRNELASMDAKLANEQFVRNAPPHIVESTQARVTELRAKLETLQQNQ